MFERNALAWNGMRLPKPIPFCVSLNWWLRAGDASPLPVETYAGVPLAVSRLIRLESEKLVFSVVYFFSLSIKSLHCNHFELLTSQPVTNIKQRPRVKWSNCPGLFESASIVTTLSRNCGHQFSQPWTRRTHNMLDFSRSYHYFTIWPLSTIYSVKPPLKIRHRKTTDQGWNQNGEKDFDEICTNFKQNYDHVLCL